MIDRAQFGRIIAGLDLALTPLMQRQYVDVNFRFVDRALRGKITFGQFLACYANFLYSYEISQARALTTWVVYVAACRGASAPGALSLERRCGGALTCNKGFVVRRA